jgi:peptide/nickel transport system permease protein
VAPSFLTAQAKGLSHSAALFRHGARLALLAVVAAMPAELAWVIGGTAVVEVVFAVDGISRFLVESIAVRDYFVLQAYIMVRAVWMPGVHLLTSMLWQRLDPRLP